MSGRDHPQRFDTLPTGHAHGHPEPLSGAAYSSVELLPNCHVLVLDQRLLPTREKYDVLIRVEQVADAIRNMAVRGAPAIGITAAYGICVAALSERGGAQKFLQEMDRAEKLLLDTRPTAVNLAWALRRMRRGWMDAATLDHSSRISRLADLARRIHAEDVAACKSIGKIGAKHIVDGASILTHCNAGALATGGYGTALGVIRAARAEGKRVRVFADETRPLFQGARLTAWELAKDGVAVTVISDSMAAHVMKTEKISCVIVGADRIAKNGDVANKIGTYNLACIAHAHGVPFYVAAPTSTIDLDANDGNAIVIEERSEREMQFIGGGESPTRIVPEGVAVRNPAFDVTPARLITAIFTEFGEATNDARNDSEEVDRLTTALTTFVASARHVQNDALEF